MKKPKPEPIEVLCCGCERPIQPTSREPFCFVCADQLGPVLMKAVTVTGSYEIVLANNVTYVCAQAHRVGDWLVLHELEGLQMRQVRLAEVVMAREVV